MKKTRGAVSGKSDSGGVGRENGGTGPPYPGAIPSGMDGQALEIIYGHNVEARRVLMQFSAAANRVIFTPEEAEDCAAKLQHYAKAARGEKPS